MRKLIIAFCCISIFLQGCATQGLWQNTSPTERIYIDHTETTEEALKAAHVKYTRCQDPISDGFLVEKSQDRKLRDAVLRVIGTPIAVAIDVATVALVVGIVWYAQEGKSGDGPI